MGTFLMDLEPPWPSLTEGDLVDFKAKLIIHDPEGDKHLFKSVLTNKFMVVIGALPNLPTFSFLKSRVVQVHPRLTIDVSDSFNLGHPTPSCGFYDKAVETCAGGGFMGEGLLTCGISIQACNDLQEELCAFQVRQGQKNVCAGDIGSPEVLKAIHSVAEPSAIVSGGFSCQPWSRLGDKKGLQDARSSSLGKILKAAHWLEARTILLECVTAAGADQQVGDLLRDFCCQTGFKMTTQDLHLETILPTKRSRWWCVISDASVPDFCIRPLPSLHPKPVLSDLLPFVPHWNDCELMQLTLDRYETNKFMEFGGLFSNLLRMDDQVRTALHGWANQLTSCPCGCRTHPFSEERLKQKGIFGALFPLQGEFNTYQGSLPMTRHMHPWEMCWIHGSNPNREWGPNLRLGIAAAGQMATPVQSCWVMAQWKSAVAALNGESIIPEQVLWSHFTLVFAAATMTHPEVTNHEGFRSFANRLHQCLVISAQANAGPVLPIGAKEEQSNSQRKGRQDPQGDVKNDQKPQSNNQPAVETQGLPQPMIFQAMPGDFPTAPGPSLPTKVSQSMRSGTADVGTDASTLCHQTGPVASHAHPKKVGGADCQAPSENLPDGAKEEMLNSQRKGRKNPPRDFEKNEQEPWAIKQPAKETPGLHPPMTLQAKPSDFPTAQGPSQPHDLAESKQKAAQSTSERFPTSQQPPGSTCNPIQITEVHADQASPAKQLHAMLFKTKNPQIGVMVGKGTNPDQPAESVRFEKRNDIGSPQHDCPSTHSHAGGITAFATRGKPTHEASHGQVATEVSAGLVVQPCPNWQTKANLPKPGGVDSFSSQISHGLAAAEASTPPFVGRAQQVVEQQVDGEHTHEQGNSRHLKPTQTGHVEASHEKIDFPMDTRTPASLVAAPEEGNEEGDDPSLTQELTANIHTIEEAVMEQQHHRDCQTPCADFPC